MYSFQENIHIINRVSPEYLQMAGQAKHLLFKQMGSFLFVLGTRGRIQETSLLPRIRPARTGMEGVGQNGRSCSALPSEVSPLCISSKQLPRVKLDTETALGCARRILNSREHLACLGCNISLRVSAMNTSLF